MTGRVVALHFSAEGKYDFTAGFYFFYAAAFLAFAVTSFSIRRFYPELAIPGWVSFAVAGLLGGISPPVY